ncbi:16S rRNA (uracil(1498)-N(3))-methyltransferase [Gordonia jinhuaensis]|uniref:Ribosomal RNA small subunit methyltransferase E n=1 Tax=Gordonia jinhuaensis TaxID=1517702 RepID=A0A916TE40_9ACTN|nr:16S rRNA (uracil(1498)-N(3))-methyltransferase [Gordonia jinhuaensis]GGB41368.1 ribosomal RNA small subunit methyltransferase E [Gordonia jinhuaensis]
MGLPVFYLEPDGAQPLPGVGSSVRLSGPEGHHAVAVTRIRAGEQILVGDGAGSLARCEVTGTAGKDVLTADVVELRVTPPPNPLVTVVQALPKSERSELAVDLATEAGADRIVAWQAARCVARWAGPRAAKGIARWRATARAAAKQSRRPWIPTVDGPIDTAQLLQQVHAVLDAGGAVAVLHEQAHTPLAELAAGLDPATPSELMLVVGPEGGLDDSEVDAIVAAGGTPVLLGPQVLRTSSAAAVALGALGVLTDRWSPAAEG